MKKHEIMIIADYSQDTPLGLIELCEVCHISSDFILDLIEYEIIEPKSVDLNEWQFSLEELQRIKRAIRLHKDLEVNLAGVALIVDLLEEIDELKEQVNLIKKHYL